VDLLHLAEDALVDQLQPAAELLALRPLVAHRRGDLLPDRQVA
jgi:hypothetical protein